MMVSSDIVKIQTSRFGELEVPKEKIITVVNGVIGFPDASEFTLLEYHPPFSWLQSTNLPDLAFVVVNGAEFGDGYTFRLPYGDREIDLQQEDEVAVINLVSIRPDPSMTTVNLKAPIVVNLKNMRGRQIILDDARFPIRMNLWTPDGSEEEEDQQE